MLLSAEDIERLERKGYSKEFFAQFDEKGYATLRNMQGHCVFYDTQKRRCKVYMQRPMGCRLYPIILDEAEGIVVDIICPSRERWSEKKKQQKGKKVIKLLEKIDAEAQQRRSA
jgi:Fe-S-cluster containining protein